MSKRNNDSENSRKISFSFSLGQMAIIPIFISTLFVLFSQLIVVRNQLNQVESEVRQLRMKLEEFIEIVE